MNTKHEETSKKKNICNICSKIIVGSAYKFKAHLYQHSIVKPRFKCSFCSKEYYRRDVYDKHCAIHTGNRKVHICDHCDRAFVDKRNLIVHLKIHDDFFDNPRTDFRCKACGANYCEERLLKYHIRKHHFNLHKTQTTRITKKVNETWVERVMESEICVEITKLNENEIKIKKSNITTEEKACDVKSLEKSSFKEYMSSVFASSDKSQYSKAVCDYCKKEMLKKSLKSHIRERHLHLKRFRCDVCKVRFSRHYQLVNHICGKFKSRGARKTRGVPLGRFGTKL